MTSRETEVAELVEQLLDVATSRHTHSGPDGESETFIECHVCGEWEGHKDGCFVAAMQAWQNAPLPSGEK